jgi:uncharacterized protein YdiU (UPF0061 family)
MRLYNILLEAQTEETYKSVVDRFQRDFPDMMDKLIEFGSYMSKAIKLENELADDESKAPETTLEALQTMIRGINEYLEMYDKTDFAGLKEKIEDSINTSLESYTNMMKRHYEEMKKLVGFKNNPPSREELEKDAEMFLAKAKSELSDIKNDVKSFGANALGKNQNYN